MLKLQEVLDFIQNSELAEFNKIRFAVDRKRSELRNDAKESFRVVDTLVCERCNQPNDNDCSICYDCTEEVQKLP